MRSIGLDIRRVLPMAAAVAVAAMAAAPFATPAVARPMTPEDVARLREVEDAAVSPDGAAVAYRLRVPRLPFRDDDGRPWSELWVTSPEGEPRPYVTGEVNVSEMAWTPEGTGVSFVAKRGEDEEGALWVISLAGGEARKVLEHETEIEDYAWAPGGRHVAFLAKDEEAEEVEELRDEGFDQEVYEEDWLSTSAWIAELPAAGDGEPVKRRLGLEGHVHEVLWCPGGDRLALTVAPDPSVDASYVSTRIRIVDPSSGAVTARVENPGKLGEVSWSPDCSALAFVAAADAHDPAPGRLMVASAADGAFRDLMPAYEGHVRDVDWRDGDTLVFVGDEGVASQVYEIDWTPAGGASAARVLVAAGETQWDDLSLSRDGTRLALLGESARHPAEVFAAPLAGAGAAPERLTASNPWLEEIDFAAQEVVTFAARDGLELQALLVRPLGARPGERYPLIVVVHGGPESHFRHGWLTSYSQAGQVGAGKGYAVVYPNYRGSTGRGVEFSKLSQARPAREEFDDLVDAVGHLVAAGLVDRERVGITGGSYGGYASAWGATRHSEHYAAAVMFVGISDKVSKLGTSDIPEELHLVHERKRLWEGWQHFLEASPIYHVERARTPLLILHGKDDPRVHPGQSLELHRALKTLGRAPVRLVLYPGEGHGNRRAASRYDYSLRMLRWFDHYLKGPGGEPPPPRLDYPLQAEDVDEEDGEEASDEEGDGTP